MIKVKKEYKNRTWLSEEINQENPLINFEKDITALIKSKSILKLPVDGRRVLFTPKILSKSIITLIINP